MLKNRRLVQRGQTIGSQLISKYLLKNNKSYMAPCPVLECSYGWINRKLKILHPLKKNMQYFVKVIYST